ncbi:hypothetical protein G3I19_01650 [Streptomyces sp. SID10853]|uniref:hypothetical protein n=1 Tax=Streptomyces sp. SID10853 TaxID=2706028 RepID=UPI0013C2488C|nr:hypothetical protein [Streptomyces sp. SID10853]NDZ77251.1 hypothetical protein [Streptomyces sp. SID10853]
MMDSAYLKTLYGADCFDRVLPAWSENYENYFHLFWEEEANLLQVDSTAPPFVVVDSFHARPSHFVSPSGEYVVYDQQLGRIFSALTNLALNEAEPDQVLACLYRLTGHRLYLTGHLDSAYYISIAQNILRDRCAPVPAPSKATWTLALAQELFTIAHEVCHILLRNEREKAGPGWSSKDSLDVVREWAGRFSAGSADTPSFFDLSGFVDGLTPSSPLIEECVCDHIAFLSMVPFIKNSGLPWPVMDSAHLALKNLHVLQLLDERVRVHTTQSEVNVSDSYMESFVRQGHLHTHIEWLSQDQANPEFPRIDLASGDLFDASIANAEKFDRVLGNRSFLFGFDRLLDQVAESGLRDHPLPPDRELAATVRSRLAF